MDFINNFGWLGKSITATVSIIPIMMLFNTFVKFGLKPEVTFFAWFLGVIIGILLIPFNLSLVKVEGLVISDFSITKPLLVLIFLGITFGTFANVLLGQALPISPNPALPFAIIGLASVVAYLLSPIAGELFPKWFASANFNKVNWAGIILLAIGVALAMYKSPAQPS